MQTQLVAAPGGRCAHLAPNPTLIACIHLRTAQLPFEAGHLLYCQVSPAYTVRPNLITLSRLPMMEK